MASVYNSVKSDVFLTSLGGAQPAAGSDTFISYWGFDYSGNAVITNDQLSVQLTSGFSGRFKDDDPLTIVCDRTGTGKFANLSNSPYVYVKSTSTAGVIHEIRIAPESNGITIVGDCTCTVFTQWKGATTLQYGFTAGANNTVRLMGGQLDVLNPAGGTNKVCKDLFIEGGRATVRRDHDTCTIYGGVCVYDDATVTPSGTVEIHGNGELHVRDSGTIASLTGFSGVLSFVGLRRALTISAGAVYPGLKIIKDRVTDSLLSWSPTTPAGPPVVQYVN